MCGICGIINFNNQEVSAISIKALMSTLKHRGPDDEGTFYENNIGFGFVRLSILDLSLLGHQPMFSSDCRFVIVYNGEVYNYIELREELKTKGYNFRSNSDTEVVLNAYIEWGDNCLNKFNGMWAFCIYDKHKKELFFSRDRYGIKPFYYYADDEHFIFASEIPPILSILKKKPEPNNQAIFDYLVFNRTDQSESTFFEGIKKLQHGCIGRLKIKDGSKKFETRKWYDLEERVEMTPGFNSGKEFREMFTSALSLRLRADVPVGVCLSGGLDSSSIVSVLLKEFDKRNLNTFSAVYKRGQNGDESEYINIFHSMLDNMFYTTPSAETLNSDLMDFVRAHAEPVSSTSIYAQFKVMELAKRYVVVTLDGQGADESLAGYHYLFGFYFKDLLKKFRILRLLSELYNYTIKHKSLFGIKSFLYFLLPKDQRSKLRISEKGYLIKDFSNEYFGQSVISNELYGSNSFREALLNHFEYKLEHLLKWEDRNSMWFSLESRVPFLDYRIVENLLASDADKLINKGMTKHILREGMQDILPEIIRTRKDKIGFETPQDEWFRTDRFKKIANDIINSESFKSRKIIHPQNADRLYQKHLEKEINISKEIWKWINIELWFREFID